MFRLVSAGLLVVVAMVAEGQFSVDDMMKPYAWTNAAGEVTLYRASVPSFPQPGKRYPLILFLHGSGECGTNNLSQIKEGLPILMRGLLKQPGEFIVVAPQCVRNNAWVRELAMQDGYKMARDATTSLASALMICREMVTRHQADPDRLYITGLSLGGFGAWDAVQREPDMFAAAVVICAGGDTSMAGELKRLPVWIFHGSEDKNVPVRASRMMYDALKKGGNRKVRYTEYEGGAHAIWDRAYNSPELLEWMLEQRRRPVRPWWKFWQIFW